MVALVAINCIGCIAKGLKKGFKEYKNIVSVTHLPLILIQYQVMHNLIEKLKEKKSNVLEAIGQTLDSIFQSSVNYIFITMFYIHITIA